MEALIKVAANYCGFVPTEVSIKDHEDMEVKVQVTTTWILSEDRRVNKNKSLWEGTKVIEVLSVLGDSETEEPPYVLQDKEENLNFELTCMQQMPI